MKGLERNLIGENHDLISIPVEWVRQVGKPKKAVMEVFNDYLKLSLDTESVEPLDKYNSGRYITKLYPVNTDSRILSLPKEWIRQRHVQKVKLIMHDSYLLIYPLQFYKDNVAVSGGDSEDESDTGDKGQGVG